MTLRQASASARYTAISSWLDQEGRVDVGAIAERLGVAQETVRRDLRTLENAGKLQRVHGGAVRLDTGPLPARVPPPAASARDEADLSLRVWARLPRRGTVSLGAGGLTLALAHTMVADPPDEPGLVVVTNSLDAAVVLARASRLEVYNIGGTVAPATRAQEGDWAVNELARLHVDVSVVCPDGISVRRGLTQATPAAAAVAQVQVSSAQRVIALADQTTLGRCGFVQFADLSQIDLVAVAGRPAPAALQPFLDSGIETDLGPISGHRDDQGAGGNR